MASRKSRKQTEAATLAQLAGGGGKGAAPTTHTGARGEAPRLARGTVGRPRLTAQERAQRERERMGKVSMLARIPRELKERLDLYRVTARRRLEDVVREALEEYLQRQGGHKRT